MDVPVIDVAPLVGRTSSERSVAEQIDAACRAHGFFTIVGHGIDPVLPARLEAAARAFFALDEREKAEIAMAKGGRAWRGWFPVGGELTSGVADRKEGIYFGTELPADDPRVVAGRPLHGANLFPARPPALRDAVLEYIAACTAVGQAVLRGIALGLGLDAGWFAQHLTEDPVVLFRIFHYPAADDPRVPEAASRWGVAEHTDYGLLTLLWQDDRGGLEVRTRDGWVDAAPVADAIVCNLGDMLDRMTGGRYRSTPHRVRPPVGRSRISYPCFLDPSWDAEVAPIPMDGEPPDDDAAARWDGTSLQTLSGTYGEYLMAKVAKVFPDLGDQLLTDQVLADQVLADQDQ